MAIPDPTEPLFSKPPEDDATGLGFVATVPGLLREGPGTRIGSYKLLQLIGEGGFGSVFMAQQEQPVQRRVALKIIKLGMDTRQVVARFEQERQALAMMDHPNIARVLDAGVTETGRPFFVMDLVKGDPIVEYCDKNNLSIQDRLELFVQVCNAVQHAHTKGIIHRDIKPSNILVSMQDGRPSTKVIDFGIAKATSARLTEKTLFTEHRQLIGTPEYMSPEQAEGSMDIDTRTDVYSLGVLLYELLTGTTPFDSVSLRSAAYAEIQRIIREVEPPIPSTRLSRNTVSIAGIAAKRKTDPRKLGVLIRGDLDWIVMKALEKERTRRYETANGLAMDIQRHLTGEAVIAAPPGAAYRVQKFIKRNRVMVSAGAAVAGALLVGVAAFAWQAKVAGEQRDKAVKAQKSEAEQRKTAEEQREAARIAADAAERAAYQAQMVSAAHAIEGQRIDAAGALLAATSPRLRGWEYRHLTSRLDRSLTSPAPADWQITGLKSAAAAATIMVRRINGASSQWVVLGNDLRTERLVLPDCNPWSLDFSPDATRVVWAPSEAADTRPTVLWDLGTGKTLATIPTRFIPHNEYSRSVSWSADGDRFMVCGGDGFEVYDGRTGGFIARREIEGWAHFTGDGRFIYLHGSRQGTDFDLRACKLLNAQSFEPYSDVLRFESPPAGGGVAFWRSRIVCSLEDGTLRVLDMVDGALRESTRIPAGMTVLQMLTWSGDGRQIAVGTLFGRIRVFDAESGAVRGEFAGPQFSTSGLAFLPDSGDLWACDLGGHHRVWPMSAGAPGVLTAHKSYVYPAAISKDGGLLLTGGWDGFVGQGGGLKRWDARTGSLVAQYGRPGEVFRSADLTPDGRCAVASIVTESESSCRTEVIDLATGTVRATFRPRSDVAHPVHTIVYPDGKRVVSTFSLGEAWVWNIASGEVLWKTDQHAQAAAVSPDGRLLALADGRLGIRLVNAETYADVRRWDAHTGGFSSLSFSPDGKWLLSASDDQTIGVWDVASGGRVARLVGHGAGVLCAAMSPDGTRIASGGRDGIVRLWDTTHFENVAQLGGHTDYIYCLVWSPDGQQLISTSGDSTVRIWDTRTLAEQFAAAHARSEVLPRLEARIAKARAGAADPQGAVEAVIASPELGARERELAQQVVARFASRGMPAYYRAPRVAGGVPIVIDGKIDEAAWEAAPWSEPFVDIEGDSKPKPRFETRVRMLWDDTNLYIAAKMEEPHVWATLSKRDDIVFHDNDFEVFVDPDGHGRWYGEVEVNALGTIFDLRLDRPYSERGTAHHEWSPPEMRAAAWIDGTLNNPSDTDRGWTVEIAIPHAALADHAATSMPPRPGDVWRINFSRVEWQHDVVGGVEGRYVKRPQTKEDNWVWTPQHVVNMHVPEHWGFVEFTNSR